MKLNYIPTQLIILLLIIIFTIFINTNLIETFTTNDNIKNKFDRTAHLSNYNINTEQVVPSNVYFNQLKNKVSVTQQLIQKEYDYLQLLINKFTDIKNTSTLSFALTNANDVNLDTQIENVIFTHFTDKINKGNRIYKARETIKSDIFMIDNNVYKFNITFILFEKIKSFSIPVKIIGSFDNNNQSIQFHKVEMEKYQLTKNIITPANQTTNDYKITNNLFIVT